MGNEDRYAEYVQRLTELNHTYLTEYVPIVVGVVAALVLVVALVAYLRSTYDKATDAFMIGLLALVVIGAVGAVSTGLHYEASKSSVSVEYADAIAWKSVYRINDVTIKGDLNETD